MVLTTHAVTGAAVITLLPTHPVLGSILALGSHFALDAIPHWDYKVSSDYAVGSDGKSKIHWDFRFLADLLKTGLDALLGLSLAWIFFFNPEQPFLWLVGVSLAMLPDFFHLVYTKYPHFPIKQIQEFHHFIHAKLHIHNLVLGVFLQAFIIGAVILISR